jgi:hypothetical protein
VLVGMWRQWSPLVIFEANRLPQTLLRLTIHAFRAICGGSQPMVSSCVVIFEAKQQQAAPDPAAVDNTCL